MEIKLYVYLINVWELLNKLTDERTSRLQFRNLWYPADNDQILPKIAIYLKTSIQLYSDQGMWHSILKIYWLFFKANHQCIRSKNWSLHTYPFYEHSIYGIIPNYLIMCIKMYPSQLILICIYIDAYYPFTNPYGPNYQI